MKYDNTFDTPFIDALAKYIEDDVSPFDVPGHHMGNVQNKATDLFGEKLYRCDVNSPIGLDNLAHPDGVVLESEKMAAKVCGADEAFYLINGTSSGIIAMFLAAVKAGEKVLLPRNVHKSVINALILCGAIPVYVMPDFDDDLEIVNQPSLEVWKRAIVRNSSAKAIFVINPTYFGSVGNLKELVEFAHAHNVAVLVDEAHGAHLYFRCKNSPMNAMDAGADMSSVSFHKTAGSLTQSSILLMKGDRFSRGDIQKSLNIINTTSPSHILIASLEGATAYMGSKEGHDEMESVYELADYAKKEIDKIPGFSIEADKHFKKYGSFGFDRTKLVIGLNKLTIDGFGVYRELKKVANVQMELAETYAVLGILAIGTKKEHIDHLIEGLKELSKLYYDPSITYQSKEPDTGFPYMLARPRVAFNAPSKIVPISELDGEISKEQVMMYPPGIPLIVPGEVWTKDLIRKLKKISKSGGRLISAYDNGFEIIDRKRWKRYFAYERKLSDYHMNRRTYPENDGYYLPFEGDKHSRTFILMPFRLDTWRNNAKPGQNNFFEVISAIAEHEEVVVGIHPSHYRKLAPMFQGMNNVKTISVRYNDSWARDNMPLFVTNGKSVRAVDFRFNSWGGEVDGLYKNYRDDDKLSGIIAKRMGVACYHNTDFILEGGSIHVDGEGTLITTEACLLSKGRNPGCSREEIEDVLKEGTGAKKIVWVPHGIYEDETNEHIDNMVAFVKPGEVVMAWSEDKDDPQYDYCQQTYKALSEATDAKGRKFIIHKVPVPSPALYLTDDEAKTLSKSATTLDQRCGGRRLAASYVNFYMGDTFIILPAFGVKEDKIAYDIMSKLFPTRKIHQLNTREILLGGGNIHCITMNMPYAEGE